MLAQLLQFVDHTVCAVAFTAFPALFKADSLKRARCKNVRFHDLRYTFAILSLQNDVDVKILLNTLGHYSADFTLDTCTHATRQMQDRAAETTGNFMTHIIFTQNKAKTPEIQRFQEFPGAAIQI